MSMKVTKQTSFSNTAMVGNITYRMVGTYGVAIVAGVLLFMTPLFRWNWPAMIAYVAFALILVGQTPTHRTVLLNLWGLLFKRPVKMVVSDMATTDTLGHGIKDVVFLDDVDAPAFKTYTNHYLFVYNITSGMTQWSTDEDYEKQATRLKGLFNIMEGTESLMIVTKQDADTGMLQLEKALEESESFEGDDLATLANNRRTLLHRVATQDVGRSVQQYAILKVKPKNTNRCTKALKKAARIITPASHPVDVLLSAMGLEAGAEQRDNVELDMKIDMQIQKGRTVDDD